MSADAATQREETIYAHLGGEAGLRELVGVFYASIFDGPARYSAEFGGFPAIVSVHRGLKITPEQRQRFIELFARALDGSGRGADSALRAAVLSCIEYGTEIAMVNSNARSDDELHPQRDVPHWHW
jgi:hemoglobin